MNYREIIASPLCAFAMLLDSGWINESFICATYTDMPVGWFGACENATTKWNRPTSSAAHTHLHIHIHRDTHVYVIAWNVWCAWYMPTVCCLRSLSSPYVFGYHLVTEHLTNNGNNNMRSKFWNLFDTLNAQDFTSEMSQAKMKCITKSPECALLVDLSFIRSNCIVVIFQLFAILPVFRSRSFRFSIQCILFHLVSSCILISCIHSWESWANRFVVAIDFNGFHEKFHVNDAALAIRICALHKLTQNHTQHQRPQQQP